MKKREDLQDNAKTSLIGEPYMAGSMKNSFYNGRSSPERLASCVGW